MSVATPRSCIHVASVAVDNSQCEVLQRTIVMDALYFFFVHMCMTLKTPLDQRWVLALQAFVRLVRQLQSPQTTLL